MFAAKNVRPQGRSFFLTLGILSLTALLGGG
jgi:hypothetical protein